ncbi:MAG: hypothetical protein K2N74_04315, partial [Clostridiales bacterium]|nr:hypothetical protein [Clostridiales bacterium]
YMITAHFTLKPTYQTNYYVDTIQIRLEIYAGKTALTVKWDKNTFTYSGVGQHPSVTLIGSDGNAYIPEAGEDIQLEYVITGSSVSNTENGREAVVVGSYQVEVRIADENVKYVLKNGAEQDEQLTYEFDITKATLATPTAAGERESDGNLHSIAELLGTTYSDKLMSLAQQYEETDAGSYRASIALLDTRNSEWEDGTTTSVTITWKISKRVLFANWNTITVVQGGSVPYVKELQNLIGDDVALQDNLDAVLVYAGTTTLPTAMGTYQISVRLNSAALSKNYMIDPETSLLDFVVVPDENLQVIDIEWDATSFTFDGASHTPVVKAVYDMDGIEVSLTFTAADYSGDMSAKWAKEGGYTISVKAPNGYYIRKGAQLNYNIIANSDGKGGLDDANNPFNPANDGEENKGGGDNGDNNTLNIPLWQVIVSGISTVLFVVCAAKSYSNFSKAKEAKRETKELAAQSYAVNYAFAPLPLLAVGSFLGMGEKPWTVIAFVTLGLFVISLVLMLLTGKKRKAAALALKREQARVAEEKEFAREEEQLRRE